VNVEERLRDALHAYDRVEPAGESFERLRATPIEPRGRRDVRSFVVALAVVMAMGAIVGVRLIADRDGGQVRLVTPVVSPTGDASLLPSSTPSSSESPSVSPSPSPSPIGDKIHYVSADGTWELLYPKEWSGPSTAQQSWTLENSFKPPQLGYPAPDGATDVQFSIHTYTGDLTLDELLNEDCKEHSDNEVFECKMVEVNGWTWTWALQYSEEEWPVMVLASRTLVGDKLYNAFGYVYGESDYDHEPRMTQIREVFNSFVLNP